MGNTQDQRLPRTKTAAPELPPSDTKRWTPRRKASVANAVRKGVISLDEVCNRYGPSNQELLSWHYAMEMHGVPGLRTTRLRVYRDIRRRSAPTGTEVSVTRHEHSPGRGLRQSCAPSSVESPSLEVRMPHLQCRAWAAIAID